MAQDQASKKSKGEKPKRRLLTRSFNLPVRGRLGRRVTAPRWLRTIGGYFVGSWQELREVRWPTRRATWGLTSAVVLFTFVFVALILGLDFGFEQLFKRILF